VPLRTNVTLLQRNTRRSKQTHSTDRRTHGDVWPA